MGKSNTASIFFRENIRTLRFRQKHTLEQMGKLVDLSASHVHCLEKGKREASLDIAARFSDVFNCKISKLLETKI